MSAVIFKFFGNFIDTFVVYNVKTQLISTLKDSAFYVIRTKRIASPHKDTVDVSIVRIFCTEYVNRYGFCSS